MKLYLFIAVGILLASCSSPATEKPSEKENKELKEPVEVRNLLKEYEAFIATLDSKNEKSMTAAAEKYAELFSGSDQKICDSAYVVFDGLYTKIEGDLNDKLMNDKFFADFPCVGFDSLGREEAFEKKYRPFKTSIEQNGFRIDCPEGMAEIGQDRSFVSKHLYKYVSPTMKQFLEALRKERDEGFSNDAGISISSKEHVDRLIWWEKFNQANPDFILSRIAKSYQVLLFHFLLTGMDNTPLINSFTDDHGTEKKELDVYFAEAYAYLNKKYPNSEINALVKPYKMTILKNDEVKRERLIKTYTKRSLMIDFEKGYDLEL